MRYLVTGGTGLVGAHVTQQLAESGHEVTAFDLAPDRDFVTSITAPGSIHRVQFVTGDVTDANSLAQVMRSAGTERVIHLAAFLSQKSDENPVLSLRVNCEGNLNVFEAALACGVARVVWGSSVAVFGPPSRRPAGPTANDAFHRPSNLYGACKALNEVFARHYRRTRGLQSVGLRFTLVYGYGKAATLARGTGGGFLVELIDKPALGIPGRIPAGDAILDLIYVGDAARAAILASMAPDIRSIALNIGGQRISLRDAAELVRKLIPAAELTVEDGSWENTDHHYDSLTARDEIGYVPEVSLADGFALTIAKLRSSR